LARAHEARPDAAAHPLLERDLARHAAALRELRHGPEHRFRPAGQHGVVDARFQKPFREVRHKAALAGRAVVRGQMNRAARALKLLPQDDAPAGAKAQDGRRAPPGPFRGEQERRRADPAADEQQPPARQGEAVPERAEQLDGVPGTAPGEKARPRAARLDHGGDGAVRGRADADRAAQQGAAAAPDMKELTGRGRGGELRRFQAQQEDRIGEFSVFKDPGRAFHCHFHPLDL
jgi:hypothetical protein